MGEEGAECDKEGHEEGEEQVADVSIVEVVDPSHPRAHTQREPRGGGAVVVGEVWGFSTCWLLVAGGSQPGHGSLTYLERRLVRQAAHIACTPRQARPVAVARVPAEARVSPPGARAASASATAKGWEPGHHEREWL